MLVRHINNFKLNIVTPYWLVASCNRGYYIDEQGKRYGKEVKVWYKNFYDPITLQILPTTEWILEPLKSKIYWYNPHTQQKELIYEPK